MSQDSALTELREVLDNPAPNRPAGLTFLSLDSPIGASRVNHRGGT